MKFASGGSMGYLSLLLLAGVRLLRK
ncbi:MAG: GlyGly-CTERM sorting domain-containing protein [Shewanella sp.]